MKHRNNKSINYECEKLFVYIFKVLKINDRMTENDATSKRFTN